MLILSVNNQFTPLSMLKGQILYTQSNRRRQSQNLEKNIPKQMTIYDEVEKDMSPQYLAYINQLVKPVKYPKTILKKQNKQDKVDEKDNADEDKQKYYDLNGQQTGRSIENLSIQQIPIKLNKIEGLESSAKDDIKNSIRYVQDLNQSLKMRKQSSIDRVIQKQKKQRSYLDAPDNKSFLEDMDRYVENLQRKNKQKEFQFKEARQWQRKKFKQPSREIFRSNQKARLEQLSQILEQNGTLQYRVTLYEQRFEHIQKAVYTMIQHFQSKQNALKKEIKSLTRALKLAIDKVNVQEEQIIELRTFYNNFQNQLEMYNSQRFNNQTVNLFKKKQNQRQKQRQKLKNRQRQREISNKLKTQYNGARDFHNLKTEEFESQSPPVDRFPSDRFKYNLYTPSTFSQSRQKTNSCVLPTKNYKLINTKNSKELEPNNNYKFKTKTRKGSQVIYFQH